MFAILSIRTIYMKRIFTLLFTFISLTAFSATYTTIRNGRWNDASTWASGLIPSVSGWGSNEIIINHEITLVPNINLSGPSKLTVSASGSLITGSSGNFNISIGEQAKFINNGDIRNVGALSVSSNAVFDFQSGTISANTLSVNGGNSSNNTLATFISKGDLTISGNISIGGSGKFDMQSGELKVGGSFTSTGGDTFTNLAGKVTISEGLINTGSSKMTSSAILKAKSFTNSGGNPSTSFKSTGSMTISNDFYNQGLAVTEGLVTVGGKFTSDWGSKTTINSSEFKVSGNITNNGYIDGTGIFTWGGTISQGWGAITHPVYNAEVVGPAVPSSIPQKMYNLGDGVPLPVRLLFFSGESRNGVSLFAWATLEEENFDRFEIEMSSDARNFRMIGVVASTGQGRGDYTFDYNQAHGTFYYRLKAIDLNGEAEYLKMISVKNETERPLMVYPNPVTNHELTVNLGKEFKQGEVKVYHKNGTLALSRDLFAIETSLSLESLQPNVYYVVITADESISRTRIIVQ
jgi:hypothetical protein